MPSTTRPNDLADGATVEDLDDVLTPAMTDAEAATARPIREVPGSLQAVLPKKGGRPRLDDPKAHVSLRLDADVPAAYKAKGSGWQSRINDTLREALRPRKP